MHDLGKLYYQVTEENTVLRAEVGRLREALEACEISMDTAAIHGVRNVLPPAYQDSWAAAHQAARTALEESTK